MVANAHFLQMRQRVEHIGIVRTRLADRDTDDFHSLLYSERAGILDMGAIDDIADRPRLPPVAEGYRQNSLQVDAGDEFALPQIIQHVLAVLRTDPECHTTAGAAAV